jgi:hypothetical protein
LKPGWPVVPALCNAWLWSWDTEEIVPSCFSPTLILTGFPDSKTEEKQVFESQFLFYMNWKGDVASLTVTFQMGGRMPISQNYFENGVKQCEGMPDASWPLNKQA